MTRQINDAGLQLIKDSEGLRLEPYQDIKGVWTVGYGHTKNITANTPTITKDQAETLLLSDLSDAENAVEKNITVDLNDNQFSALVSLVFNVGTTPLTMTLGHHLNQGKYEAAANDFLSWCHAKINGVPHVIKGLYARRRTERDLFLE